MGKTMITLARENVEVNMMNLQLFAEENKGSEETSGDTTAAYVSGSEEEDSSLVSENSEEVAAPPETKQDPKIDSAFAKLRKEKETIEKQKRDLDSWVFQNFNKDYGIKTVDEYKEMMDKQLRETKEQELRDQGYDPDVIRDIVKNDPEISKVISGNDKQINDEKLVGDYKELSGEYPDLVKQPEDIGLDVWDLYDKGMSLVDAYTIVNRKEILDHVKSVGKQQTLNNINSKAHLSKTEGDGAKEGSDTQMSQDTLQIYMDMGMSKKEAFAHYKKLYS